MPIEERPKVTVGVHQVTVKTTDGQHEVTVFGDLASRVGESKQFQQWLDNYDHEKMPIQYIFIKDTDWVDTGNLRVLFAKLHVQCRNSANNRELAGIVFMRGNAVSIFIRVTVEETGKSYILLVRQPRVPIGEFMFIEATAGMLDGEKDVKITVLAEIFQETSLTVKKENLVYLGRMVPSAGGCDERVEMFFTDISLPERVLEHIQKIIHGESSEREQIRVMMIGIREFVRDYIADDQIEDAKILASLAKMVAKTNPEALIAALADFGR